MASRPSTMSHGRIAPRLPVAAGPASRPSCNDCNMEGFSVRDSLPAQGDEGAAASAPRPRTRQGCSAPDSKGCIAAGRSLGAILGGPRRARGVPARGARTADGLLHPPPRDRPRQARRAARTGDARGQPPQPHRHPGDPRCAASTDPQAHRGGGRGRLLLPQPVRRSRRVAGVQHGADGPARRRPRRARRGPSRQPARPWLEPARVSRGDPDSQRRRAARPSRRGGARRAPQHADRADPDHRYARGNAPGPLLAQPQARGVHVQALSGEHRVRRSDPAGEDVTHRDPQRAAVLRERQHNGADVG